jgi:TolA-binding protein
MVKRLMKGRSGKEVLIFSLILLICGAFSGIRAQDKDDLSFAKKLMHEGLYELAFDEFISFAEKHQDSPHIAEAYYLAYDCIFLQGKYRDALAKFQKFIQMFPLSSHSPFAQERMGEVLLKLGEYENAKQAFEQFIRVYPESERAEDALFWLGETHYHLQEYEKARYYYRLCMERYPDGRYQDYALFSMGYTYLDEKKYDEAIDYFDLLIDSMPGSVLAEDAYFAIGEMAFERGELDRALEMYERYRKNYPSGTLYDKSLLQTGRTYAKKGAAEDAIKAFSALIDRFPHSTYKNAARYSIGWIHFEQGAYEDAFNYFSSVEKKDKLYYPSYYWIGVILERQGKKQEAIDQFKRLSTMEGAAGYQRDAIHELARIAYRDGNREQGDILVQELQGTDRQLKALLLKANFLYEGEQYADAIMIYNEIVKAESNGVRKEAIYRLASSLYKMESYRKAEEYFNIYLTNYPEGEDRREALLLFAESAYKLKKWESALERYRSVSAQYAGTSEAKLAVMGEGYTLSKLGRDKEAYAILKKVKGPEGEGKDWLTLGDAAYNAGRFSEAIAHYKKATKEKDRREIALLKLANTYFRSKQYKNAITEYNIQVKEFPIGSFADDAYFKKAEAQRKLGDYDGSNSTLESLRTLYPSSAFVTMSLELSGDNYFNKGDFENARIHYQKGIEKRSLPEDTIATNAIHGIMKSIQRQDGEKRAVEFADTYIDRYRGSYLSERVRMLKADMLYYAGDKKAAQEEYSRVKHNRLKPAALYYEARLLQGQNQYPEAEARLKELIEHYPGSAMASKAVLLLGKVLYEEKKYSESLALLEKSDELKTDEDFEVAYMKSDLYLKLNHGEKAEKLLQRLADAATGKWKAMAYIRLGDIAAEDGLMNRAISHYDAAIKTGESLVIPEAYFKKGKALVSKGDDKEALKTFLKVKYNLQESAFTTKAIYEAAELTLKMGKKQDAASLYREVIERNDDKPLAIRAQEKLKTLNP